MTFRERLADWISGGAMTVLAEEKDWHMQERLNAWAEAGEWADRAKVYFDALECIAAEEKPASNATVKRMARIAREAME